jgi:hypothetical protein
MTVPSGISPENTDRYIQTMAEFVLGVSQFDAFLYQYIVS